MKVRAKFKVESISEHSWQPPGARTVTLVPVMNGSEENKAFYHMTPGGKIELSTINPEAAAEFTRGREFYVDFIAADGAQ